MKAHWLWRAVAGGLILGLPATALFFIRVPVLTVTDVKAGRQLLALQVRAGDSLVLSYRHPVTRRPVSDTFEVEGDGSLSAKETTFRSPGPGLPELQPGDADKIATRERLPELSLIVHPFTEHTLVVKGTSLNLSREVQQGSLVKLRVQRRFWWWTWRRKAGALLSHVRWRG